MTKKTLLSTVAGAAGAAFVTSMALASTAAISADNPFESTQLDSGYQVAGDDKKKEGKCGEGKCGEGKKKEGKCGEGKCGEGKKKEGKCGEGKCGG